VLDVSRACEAHSRSKYRRTERRTEIAYETGRRAGRERSIV